MDKHCISCGSELVNGICPICSQNQPYIYGQGEMNYQNNQYDKVSQANFNKNDNNKKKNNTIVIIPAFIILTSILVALIILILSIRNIKIPTMNSNANNITHTETMIINEEGVIVSHSNEDLDNLIKEAYKAWINDDAEKFKEMLADCVLEKNSQEEGNAEEDAEEDTEETEEEIKYQLWTATSGLNKVTFGEILEYENEYGIEIENAYWGYVTCDISRQDDVSYNYIQENGEQYTETQEVTKWGESTFWVIIVEINDEYYILDAEESTKIED